MGGGGGGGGGASGFIETACTFRDSIVGKKWRYLQKLK